MSPIAEAGLAGLPILTILVLMLGLRWSAARAGAMGLGVTVLLAWGVFGYGRGGSAAIDPLTATAGAVSEAVFTAATILWIHFAALSIHHLQLQSGAVDAVERRMVSLAKDTRIVGLLAWWLSR